MVKAREINPFGLRLPPEVKQVLEREAEANHRSLNAEVVSRIKMTLEGPLPRAAPTAREANPVSYGEMLSDTERAMLAVFRGMSPERQLALLSLFK